MLLEVPDGVRPCNVLLQGSVRVALVVFQTPTCALCGSVGTFCARRAVRVPSTTMYRFWFRLVLAVIAYARRSAIECGL